MHCGLMRLAALLPLAVSAGVAGCGSGSDSAGPPPVVNPPAGFAYVTDTGTNAGSPGRVLEYAILNDGSASPLTPVSVTAGVGPAAVILSNRHAYVVNVGDGTVSQYDIAADSSLAPMVPPVVSNPGMKTLGVMPGAAIVDPSGSFLYVANSGDDSVSQFSIGGEGQLTALTPATVPAGVGPVALAVTAGPGGSHLYVVNSGGVPAGMGSVSQFSIGADGTLTPVNPATVAVGALPVAIAIDQGVAPFGAAYLMSDCDGPLCTGSITQFAVGAGGELTATGATATTGAHYNAVGMVTDQTGANAYVLTNLMGVDTNNGALWQFGVGGTGALRTPAQPTVSIAPRALAQTLFNGRLCILTANAAIGGSGGGISCYTLDAAGVPTLAASTTLDTVEPVSMATLYLLPP